MQRMVFAAVALCLLPVTAPAQQQMMLCGLRDDMGRMLAQRFGEQPRGAGLVGDRIAELLVNEVTGSWTLLLTTADGRSCIVTGGEDWTETPARPDGAGQPNSGQPNSGQPERGI